MILKKIISLAAILSTACWVTTANSEELVREAYTVEIQKDLTYGQAEVGVTSASPHLKNLKLDLYRPLENGKAMSGRPAVVLAFGGAFLRGSKGTTKFEEDGASDSAMGDYCQALALAGYVCLSIEYRLMTDDPALPKGLPQDSLSPKALLKNPVMTGRIDVVRARMGLPALDDASREQLWNTVFAASEDIVRAVNYAKTNAERLGIDAQKIAIGGFSAGGLAAVNAAYGMGAPVQAVVSLSGGTGGFTLRKTIKSGMPPGLFVMGQNDLDGVKMTTPALIKDLTTAGISTEAAWMPGYGHFYPMGAPSLGSDMSKLTLRSRVVLFLDRTIGQTTPVR